MGDELGRQVQAQGPASWAAVSEVRRSERCVMLWLGINGLVMSRAAFASDGRFGSFAQWAECRRTIGGV